MQSLHTYKPDFFTVVIWGQNGSSQMQEKLNDLFNMASLVSFYSIKVVKLIFNSLTLWIY